MLESKRKYKRFDLPLNVKFRPTYGAKDYSTGLTSNISAEGFGIVAHDFRFIMYENLELVFDIPEYINPVAITGDIVWKEQTGRGSKAGIELKMKDKRAQKEAIEKIFLYSDIPIANMYSSDSHIMYEEKTPVASSPLPASHHLNLPNKLGVIKEYQENHSTCRVTFRLLRETAGDSLNVMIVGDFNNWDASRSPMERLENGDFVLTMDLDSNREYRFRYLINGSRWENDRYADKYVTNDFGSKSSVVIV